MLLPKRKFDYLRKNHGCLAKKLAKESLKKRINSSGESKFPILVPERTNHFATHSFGVNLELVGVWNKTAGSEPISMRPGLVLI